MKNTKTRVVFDAQGYSDDLGELDGAKGEFMPKNFLPSPEVLFPDERVEKITLAVHTKTLRAIKAEAERRKYPYQRMIRNLLDWYVATPQTNQGAK